MTPGTDYKIKMASTYNISIFDQSDSNFTIVAPSITVVSPNGGEKWVGDSIYPIMWTSVGARISCYRLLYSTNNDSTYTDTLVKDLSSDSTRWNWKVPVINSNTCRIKVQMMDSLNRIIVEGKSDSCFLIQKEGIEEPSILDRGFGNAGLKIIKEKIYLDISKKMDADIKLYDLCGRIKEVIYTGTLGKGNYTFTPNIHKNGIYFVRLTAGTLKTTKKITFIR
ncbi:MAG: T9SS type A sorting domain-containing protein [bacterium]